MQAQSNLPAPHSGVNSVQALNRVTSSHSVANCVQIHWSFGERGIPESAIRPLENASTFDAGKAAGPVMRRGEHGAKVPTFTEGKEAEPDAGGLNIIRIRPPWASAQLNDNADAVRALQAGSMISFAPATPDRRPRRKSMARRSGQVGYEEVKGSWYHVRFRMDVPGQEKRAYLSKPICPVSGPGALTKPERLRKRREIIAASGADSEEHFNKIETINHGTTFRKQAEWWLNQMQARKRRPVRPTTLTGFVSYLKNWLNPNLGDTALSSVNNLAVKQLVAKMTTAGLSPKTVNNVAQVVKMVLASALNENGEQVYPRAWNHDFIDLPEIRNQRQPSFSEDVMKIIAANSEGRERMLFVLLGATGMRIGEALGLEINKHISPDFSALHIRQKVWNGRVQPFLKTENSVRDIDLHSSIAAMLRTFVGPRTSGFLFCSKNGKPLLQSNILRLSLHPLLQKAKQPKAGAHAFRRFRTTWLRKQHTPEDLIRFWLGHANRSITDVYCKLSEDVAFRKKVAEQVGIGFELPAEKLEAAPNCTQSELLSTFA
jgi:integrase